MSSTITRKTFLKKIAFFFFSLFFTNVLFSKSNNKKIVIVYITRTNNTKEVARMIHELVDADLVELETKKLYPKDYKQMVKQVKYENEIGYLPILENIDIDFNQYDIIFLGFPTWGMQLPPPIKTFLNNNDFQNKVLIPFNTNAGFGEGSSFKTIKQLSKNAKILEGFSTKGGVERDDIYFVMNGIYKNKVRKDLTRWLKRVFFI